MFISNVDDRKMININRSDFNESSLEYLSVKQLVSEEIGKFTKVIRHRVDLNSRVNRLLKRELKLVKMLLYCKSNKK